LHCAFFCRYGQALRLRLLDKLNGAERRRAALARGDKHALIDTCMRLQERVDEMADLINRLYLESPWARGQARKPQEEDVAKP
jgi:hypothetical protein